MRSHAVAMSMAVSGVCAGGACAVLLPIFGLQESAEWHLARGNAEAQRFVASLDGDAAERQLAEFENRRAALESAHQWRQAQGVLAIAAVLAAFTAFVLHLLKAMGGAQDDRPLPGPMGERPLEPELAELLRRH